MTDPQLVCDWCDWTAPPLEVPGADFRQFAHVLTTHPDALEGPEYPDD